MIKKHILTLAIICVNMPLLTMDNHKIDHQKALKKTMAQQVSTILVETNAMVESLQDSPEPSIDTWFSLIKNIGKLELLIECEYIKDPQEQQDVNQGIQHLNSAFKNHIVSERKEKLALLLTQLANITQPSTTDKPTNDEKTK